MARRPATPKTTQNQAVSKKINLALQGGGAHGAFTWGVLDRLLEDGRLEIEGLSGTSAGAINAAMVVQGYQHGGREGARVQLDRFWHALSQWSGLGPVHRTWVDVLFAPNPWNLDHGPSFLFFDMLSRIVSPYQANPLDFNPLRELLNEMIDPSILTCATSPKLFVSTTNVRNGKVKIFDCENMSVDALLASACLPFLVQAVEIDGEHYWDGGYMGNPALYPLIYHCDSEDIMVVQINPIVREKVPTTAAEIFDRVNEITFNSSLMREMRAIHFVQKLVREEGLDAKGYKDVKIHLIAEDEEMRNLGIASKLNAELDFLLHMKAVGRRAADEWLAAHFDQIGVETTVDIRETFL